MHTITHKEIAIGDFPSALTAQNLPQALAAAVFPGLEKEEEPQTVTQSKILQDAPRDSLVI